MTELAFADRLQAEAWFAAELPNLEHLELWLGTDSYGGDATVADLADLLREHGSLEALLENAVRISKPALRTNLLGSREALLAFKDMAMQLLGNLFEYELARRGTELKARRRPKRGPP